MDFADEADDLFCAENWELLNNLMDIKGSAESSDAKNNDQELLTYKGENRILRTNLEKLQDENRMMKDTLRKLALQIDQQKQQQDFQHTFSIELEKMKTNLAFQASHQFHSSDESSRCSSNIVQSHLDKLKDLIMNHQKMMFLLDVLADYLSIFGQASTHPFSFKRLNEFFGKWLLHISAYPQFLDIFGQWLIFMYKDVLLFGESRPLHVWFDSFPIAAMLQLFKHISEKHNEATNQLHLKSNHNEKSFINPLKAEYGHLLDALAQIYLYYYGMANGDCVVSHFGNLDIKFSKNTNFIYLEALKEIVASPHYIDSIPQAFQKFQTKIHSKPFKT